MNIDLIRTKIVFNGSIYNDYYSYLNIILSMTRRATLPHNSARTPHPCAALQLSLTIFQRPTIMIMLLFRITLCLCTFLALLLQRLFPSNSLKFIDYSLLNVRHFPFSLHSAVLQLDARSFSYLCQMPNSPSAELQLGVRPLDGVGRASLRGAWLDCQQMLLI